MAETGSHEQLMRSRGLYHGLVTAQVAGGEGEGEGEEGEEEEEEKEEEEEEEAEMEDLDEEKGEKLSAQVVFFFVWFS